MKTALVIFIFLIGHAIVKAEDQAPEAPVAAEETPTLDEERPALNLAVGVDFSRYRYVEPGLISHEGLLIGTWLEWFYDTGYFRGLVQTRLQTGTLTYDGGICDSDTKQCRDYTAKTTDIIFKLAHRFSWNFTEQVGLFVGAGYRFLYDKGETAAFYRRIGQYFYLPVGFTIKNFSGSDAWPLVFDFEYDHFISGEMQSKFSDLDSSKSDLTHGQNKGMAMRFTLSYRPEKTSPRPFDDFNSWVYSLYYEKWTIPESAQAELYVNGAHSGKYYFEPHNFSETIGLQAGWSY